MYKYYVLVEYSSWWSTVKEGVVIELPKPLETHDGLRAAINYLRQKHADAIILWWEKLDG